MRYRVMVAVSAAHHGWLNPQEERNASLNGAGVDSACREACEDLSNKQTPNKRGDSDPNQLQAGEQKRRRTNEVAATWLWRLL